MNDDITRKAEATPTSGPTSPIHARRVINPGILVDSEILVEKTQTDAMVITMSQFNLVQRFMFNDTKNLITAVEKYYESLRGLGTRQRPCFYVHGAVNSGKTLVSKHIIPYVFKQVVEKALDAPQKVVKLYLTMEGIDSSDCFCQAVASTFKNAFDLGIDVKDFTMLPDIELLVTRVVREFELGWIVFALDEMQLIEKLAQARPNGNNFYQTPSTLYTTRYESTESELLETLEYLKKEKRAVVNIEQKDFTTIKQQLSYLNCASLTTLAHSFQDTQNLNQSINRFIESILDIYYRDLFAEKNQNTLVFLYGVSNGKLDISVPLSELQVRYITSENGLRDPHLQQFCTTCLKWNEVTGEVDIKNFQVAKDAFMRKRESELQLVIQVTS